MCPTGGPRSLEWAAEINAPPPDSPVEDGEETDGKLWPRRRASSRVTRLIMKSCATAMLMATGIEARRHAQVPAGASVPRWRSRNRRDVRAPALARARPMEARRSDSSPQSCASRMTVRHAPGWPSHIQARGSSRAADARALRSPWRAAGRAVTVTFAAAARPPRRGLDEHGRQSLEHVEAAGARGVSPRCGRHLGALQHGDRRRGRRPPRRWRPGTSTEPPRGQARP